MPSRHRCCLFTILWLLGCSQLVMLTPGTASAQAMSIQEFLTHEHRWKDLAAGDVLWHIEGRYSVISHERVQFAHCSLPFLLPPEAFREKGSSTVVEVSGKLSLEQNKLVFRVASLRGRPSDRELLQSRRSHINPQQPQDWYRVADWAQKRGEFYEDQELLTAARTLYGEGLLKEAAPIDPAQPEALTALVKKGQGWQVEPSIIERIVHQTLWGRYEQLRDQPFSAEQYDALLERLDSSLTGAVEPQRTLEESELKRLTETYLQNPRRVFEKADAAQRIVLARIFRLEVVTDRVLHDAAPDGANGFEIAARLEQAAPERREQRLQQEDRAIAYQRKQISSMTRGQMLQLAERLERRDAPQTARDIKQAWLESREEIHRRDGARGLSDLAEQWLLLLNDKEMAAALHSEAWEINPEYPPAIDWLKANGYVLHSGTWMPAGDVPVKPKTARELAIEQGRVELGMSPEDVRSALGVLPQQVVRIASSGTVTELWMYDAILIRFSRRSGAAAGRVVSVEAVTRSYEKSP